jgi:hypothetical protein
LVREKLKKLEAEHVLILEVMQNAKKSAATIILQSRILMVELAATQGFELNSCDLEAWKKVLASLNGEEAGPSGIDDVDLVVEPEAAEKMEKVEKVVLHGDGGNDAKA